MKSWLSPGSVITNTESQDWDGEEIPTLVVIFVGGTVTVLVLVTGLILANTMKRRIAVKAELPEYQQDYQVSAVAADEI